MDSQDVTSLLAQLKTEVEEEYILTLKKLGLKNSQAMDYLNKAKYSIFYAKQACY